MRISRTRLFAAATAGLALAACAPADTALTDADREAIRALHRDFVGWVKSKNSEALSQIYVADGVLMAPGAPAVIGRADIKAFGDAFPPVTEFSLTEETIDGNADVAYVRGSYSITLGVPGSPAEDGKFVEVWRKQPDGTWKLAIDIWNSDLAPVMPADSAPQAP